MPTKALGVKDMGSRSPSSLDISIPFFAAHTSCLLRYHYPALQVVFKYTAYIVTPLVQFFAIVGDRVIALVKLYHGLTYHHQGNCKWKI